MRRFNFMLFGAILLPVLCRSALAEVKYAYKDLGTLGGRMSLAFGINEQGDVVGSAWTDDFGTTHAFLNHAGQMTDLGTPYGTFSVARGINSSGQIVVDSASQVVNGGRRSYLLSGGKYTELTDGVATAGNVVGINDAGRASGTTASYPENGFIYSAGRMEVIRAPRDYRTFVGGINNKGQAIGSYRVDYGARTDLYGFVYANGSFIREFGLNVTPAAINDQGDVTGYDVQTGQSFIDRGGRMTKFGIGISNAHDINNRGDVVGDDYVGNVTTPFLFSDGKLQDLNALIAPIPGIRLTFANAINDAGQIVGEATTSEGYWRAFFAHARS